MSLSIKIGEAVLTADTCGEDNTLSFNFAPDLSATATSGAGGGDNTEGGNDDDATGNTCGETMCSDKQHCENDTCVCNEGTFTCDPDTSSENACCAEGYYCGSENEDEAEYKCLPEEGCGDCSNSTSWTTGAVSVTYCKDQSTSCYEASPSSCASITVTCGTEGTGRKYCYSRDFISWWDANSMCKALGMRLPTVDELVTGWKNSSSSEEEHFTRTQFAQNMRGIMGPYHVFSSNLSSSCLIWYVGLDNGSTDKFLRNINFFMPLCVR